jgi:methyl-accepting chemotaxis protein
LTRLRRRPTAVKETAAPIESDSQQRAYERVVRDVAGQAAGLGLEAAQLHGLLDDVAQVAQRESAAFGGLSEQIQGMVAANDAIAHSVETTLQSAGAAREAVERVAEDVDAAQASLREVAQVAADITRIALQTRLVAFNAAVEAKHAGAAGRGFAVVAEAVKELSEKVESSSKAIARTVGALDGRIGELARNVREHQTLPDGNPTFSLAFDEVLQATHAIAEEARRNIATCAATRTAVHTLQAEVAETTATLGDARGRAECFLSASEHLIQVAADQGAQTADTPYIEQVIAAAAQVAQCFEDAVQRGEITLEALFDADYQAIAGTAPQQLRTRFVEFTDRVLPPIQEPLLQFSDKVVFCAAVDRNGFLPTHNRKFSQPQGTDPVWNAANCRNRRLFNDRTGAAAGANLSRFLLQTYRRDLGGGNYALMKDVSAPIHVAGRHWGGLRLAYRF